MTFKCNADVTSTLQKNTIEWTANIMEKKINCETNWMNCKRYGDKNKPGNKLNEGQVKK